MKNNRRCKIFYAWLILITAALSAVAQNKISVRFPAEVKVETNTIKLGDIAEISGASGETIERMKNIALGYAPNVGLTRDLTLEKIRLAIAAAGFAPNEFTLDAAPAIRIRRAGQEISQNQFKEAVEAEVARLFTDKNVSAKIIRLDLPAVMEVPTGKIDVRVNLTGVRNYFAVFAAPIEVRVNDAVVRRLAANVEIEAFADILIAVKDLSYGEKISEQSVRLENRRLVKPLANYLRSTENLGGLKLIKNISNGVEITKDSFIADAVVRFGDAVRIVGESGKLQISVTGEARANGKIGDRIAVKNTQSNAVLQAVVVDAGTVKILF